MRTKQVRFSCCAVLLSFCVHGSVAQQTRVVNQRVHTWIGLFTTQVLDNRWGIRADFLVRRDEFLSERGFYFAALGGGYWFSNGVSVSSAFSNLWLYNPNLTDRQHTRENRLDQQLVVSSNAGRLAVMQRFRVESRWRQNVVNNEVLGTRNYSMRVRYMYSFGLPLSRKARPVSLVLNNEILLQFGKQIIVNPLDQIRVFVGIRQPLSNGYSYDLGYFPILQQTAAGNVYNFNHTVRLHFYYNRRPRALPKMNTVLSENGE